MDITPILNLEKGKPLYVQLYQHIKDEIEVGRMVAGAKLPSIRQLALHLKVSKNTVETAYQQLLAEGYIESMPKSGMRVVQLEEDFPKSQSFSIFPKVKTEPTKKVLYDFQYGDIELDSFPLRIWKKYLNEALYQPSDVLMYGEKQGDYKLREQICSYLLHSRGIHCQPEQVLLTAGTQSSMNFLLQILQLQGKTVAMEDPGYDGVRSVFKLNQCETHAVELESDGLKLDQLEKLDTKLVYVTPSHQFPVGMVMSIQKRLKLLNWAKQHNAFIVEDDYDSEFRYEGQPIPALKSLDKGEKVIYLGTFSKSFLPSARLSYIVFPPNLIEKYKDELNIYSQGVSPIIQRAVFLFMCSGDFDRHIRKMRKLYHEKHRVLLESIKLMMGNRVEVIGEKAGLHILLRVKNDYYLDLIEKGLKKGVKVYSTKPYWQGETPFSDDLVLLGFGGLTVEQIKDGIRLLSQAWFSEND
ncbi:PLP-dependent aminotransferase family protein [Bacillus sp. 31A1R]|uniref:PLP-dependent aminotransferase family protein n=1 Tax=Robertmurraya mangrovi TaxID=3098077 RepID=A0ABU5J027_9BACI|nr:PLP-dependent aminotransferase family protein [Bacillus sp. 31A1R]MDZ5472764.1 PLP-dependent aminotransferase family protein [Bacillus sp. 31A1R]